MNPVEPNFGAGADPRPEVNRWVISVAVMLSTFMEILDTTVVNVSLPHIAGSLSATVDESTWALTPSCFPSPAGWRTISVASVS
jgi:MFS family permease